MAIYSGVFTPQGTPQTASGYDCSPSPCPECGGLECLCRPRFFAGQLLTEEDLNRLDRYILAKNRLHNRYLHGWGVVCGLKVLCHPCPGYVTVTSGYALSPCGDDIIVCKDDIVPVCDLINQCVEACRRQRECDPLGNYSASDCEQTDGIWYLTIRYLEKPSRGVMPLKNPPGACGCARCQCGGSSACGCGCHGQSNGSGNGNGHAKTSTTSKQQPIACEPTVTCESYVYEVCRETRTQPTDPPSPDPAVPGFTPSGNLSSVGTFSAGVASGMQPYFALVQGIPQAATAEQVYQMALDARDYLLGQLDCRSDADYAGLKSYQPPTPGANTPLNIYRTQVLTGLSDVVSPYLSRVFCRFLLPDCPGPVQDARVCLAKLRVRNTAEGCVVTDICNLSCRRFVVTFPNIGYWLSWLPSFRLLRVFIERLCCGRASLRGVQDNAIGRGMAQPMAAAAVVAPERAEATPVVNPVLTPNRSRLIGTMFRRMLANRTRALDMRTLFLGSLGEKDAEGRPLLSTEEQQSPVEAILLNQVVVPALSDLLTEDQSTGFEPASGLSGGAPPPTPAVPPEEVAGLRAQMADMDRRLQEQQRVIEELQRRLNQG